MSKLDPKDLLATGAHFGHKTSRWHPKMAPYIYGKKDGVHILDLTKTVDLVQEAVELIEKKVAGGGDVLFVGTKLQAKALVKDAAQSTKMHWVSERWMGGTLTNFETMNSRIKHLKKLEEQMESGDLEAKYNKLEVQRFGEEIEKLNLDFGGIKDMQDELPSVVIVLDAVDDNIAVREANKLNIPVVGVCDSNANPDLVDFVIPANDDSVKTLKLLLDQFQQAVERGQARFKSKAKDQKAEKSEEKSK